MISTGLFIGAIAIGLGILLIALLIDGVLEDFLFDGAVPCLACAATVFGASGLIASAITGGAVSIMLLIVSAIVGLISAVIFYFFYKAFKRNGERVATPVSQGEIVGRTAKVLWWSKNAGEVLLEVRGNLVRLTARSAGDLELSAEQDVRIESMEDADTAIVSPVLERVGKDLPKGGVVHLGDDPLYPHGDGTIRKGDPMYDLLMSGGANAAIVGNRIGDSGDWNVSIHEDENPEKGE